MSKNLFIALEGIDGSGKSSQVKLLAKRLEDEGHKVYATFEPSDRFIGATVRNILKGNIKADHETIAALFLADRLDHLLNEENGLVKKMKEGFTVITDRYYFSSYAYHSTHVDMNWVISSNKICANILRPDINIFIDVPPEVSMQRITANRETTELFETLDSLKAVRANYLQAFEKLGNEEKITTIEGNRTINAIAEDIWQTCKNTM
jgi:dTMP kinase